MDVKRHRREDLIPYGSKPLQHPPLFWSESSTTELWVLGIDQDQKFEGKMRSRSLKRHRKGDRLTVGVWVSFNGVDQTEKQNVELFGK